MPTKHNASKMAATAFNKYVANLEKALRPRDATEHTHRPALKALIEAIAPDVVATNEPKRIAAGAPDFSLKRKAVPLGYIETKDIGTSLDEMSRGRGRSGGQFKRYLKGLSNWGSYRLSDIPMVRRRYVT